MKERTRKVVVGSDFFLRNNNNKGHTDDTQISLRATLLLCLGVPSEWQVECILLLWYLILWNTTTTLRTLDFGTNVFAKGPSSVNWKQSLEHHQQSVTSAFATTLAAVLDPFTERLSGWKKIFLTSAGTQTKRDGIFLPTTRTREWRKGSVMTAFIRSTDEEIEANYSKLFRDVIEVRENKKEKQF